MHVTILIINIIMVVKCGNNILKINTENGKRKQEEEDQIFTTILHISSLNCGGKDVNVALGF